MAFIGNQPFTAAFLTDTFSGTGSQVAYTMTVAPANTSSIIVAVTGVLQDPSTYSVSGTTLTFSGAPPSGTSNISVRYLGIPASGVTTTAYRTVTNFTATAGQTSFSVPSYTVGYIDVYRNGVRLVNGSTDFVATTGTTVVLNNACTVGDSVVTESFLVSSVLNAIQQYNGSSTNQALTTPTLTSPTITTPTVSQITSAAATALTLQSAGTTAITIDTSQNVSLTAAGTVLKNSSGNPILRQSGSVLKVQQFTDPGSTTTSGSLVNLNGSAFSYTPVSTNSTLYLTVTAYAYNYPAAGYAGSPYSFYAIGEYNGSAFVAVSNPGYLWSFQYSTGYSQSISAQAYMTCTRSNTALTARSFDLMGGVSNSNMPFTANNIVFTVMEVAN